MSLGTLGVSQRFHCDPLYIGYIIGVRKILRCSMSSTAVRERETDDTEEERLAKRVKMDGGHSIESHDPSQDMEMPLTVPEAQSTSKDLLPPSRRLLPSQEPKQFGGDDYRVSEPDVGISEYIANDIPQIQGIIKQRYAPLADRLKPSLMHWTGSLISWYMKWIFKVK
jgi:hypothetical protein